MRMGNIFHKETVFIALVLFLPGVKCVDSRNVSFKVENDKIIISKDATAGPFKLKSTVECATMCSGDASCCTASYDKITRQCLLSSFCNPETVNTYSGKYIQNHYKVAKDTCTVEYFIVIAENAVFIFTAKDTCTVEPAKPVDCADIATNCGSGIYDIYPSTTYPITVYCDMTGSNWTVIQRRVNDSVDFYKNWIDYKTGFGNLAGNFWLGNDNIHAIVNSRSYMIRFDLEDWTGIVRYAEYETFRIGDESDNYKLTLDDYDGDAGDITGDSGTGEIDGQQFSTADRDNANYVSLFGQTCADQNRGAWWYNECGLANLNGVYYNYPTNSFIFNAIYWQPFNGRESLKSVSMKIRVEDD
ncbi:Fibrinogen-like protein 1,Fibrinogen-like protein A,Ryncolin-2,Angiopoietin-1,Techylectin-5B,Angiopoietin-related protein 2,Microfibril-associated glycoprotein 4,Techylectin-5A,Fibrinogen alpha chain,Angiopoietin-related protein 7,Ficolin-2,Ryncolin-1,Ryncolin-3,Ficolin-1,Angiopoietin-4, Fibrinogen gamma chain [Mytilus coruscus]|uniref:Fibrinogen C-terminal domain-containing protein n=1 Tax=Mytilus coruscus TaxID=42192 RepID=A0A6J8D9H6_MYTCO|nr:Fibrinogen-like protein 1,Fibrinogen-like protein A,Ryncolin-2,Angiopoietin-1,Techylectin-5B,Angiopoietin-related protein 2,Microfibril-associated glycoprotein 4,Techylectin-5A,Fibrinogen alpha chain,Angiopoietin-related protein 7,Ficolin-2,Ryncolin-1,Ryncolin-3,Ficolin-1,Angiopoietin-4, Fibrinogen gamma chain [Mytilus coruscus]